MARSFDPNAWSRDLTSPEEMAGPTQRLVTGLIGIQQRKEMQARQQAQDALHAQQVQAEIQNQQAEAQHRDFQTKLAILPFLQAAAAKTPGETVPIENQADIPAGGNAAPAVVPSTPYKLDLPSGGSAAIPMLNEQEADAQHAKDFERTLGEKKKLMEATDLVTVPEGFGQLSGKQVPRQGLDALLAGMYRTDNQPDRNHYQMHVSTDPLTGERTVDILDTQSGRLVGGGGGRGTAPAPAGAPGAAAGTPGASGPVHSLSQLDWSKTGEDFLAQLPPQVRNNVKSIGDYDQNPAAMGRGNRQLLQDMVKQYNPAYNDQLYAQRSQLRKEFTGTKGQGAGSNIVALRTAVRHLNELAQESPGVGGGDVTAFNRLRNYIKTNFEGSPDVLDYTAAQTAFKNELDTLLRRAAATNVGVKEWGDVLGPQYSPKARQHVFAAIGKLMNDRAKSLQEQWHAGMDLGGKKAEDFPIYTPEVQQMLNQLIGSDPNAAPAAGGLSPAAQALRAKYLQAPTQ